MQTKPLYLFLLLGALCSCSTAIRIEKVKELFIDYNPEMPNNYGTPIHARVGARMKNGQVLYVTTPRNYRQARMYPSIFPKKLFQSMPFQRPTRLRKSLLN